MFIFATLLSVSSWGGLDFQWFCTSEYPTRWLFPYQINSVDPIHNNIWSLYTRLATIIISCVQEMLFSRKLILPIISLLNWAWSTWSKGKHWGFSGIYFSIFNIKIFTVAALNFSRRILYLPLLGLNISCCIVHLSYLLCHCHTLIWLKGFVARCHGDTFHPQWHNTMLSHILR